MHTLEQTYFVAVAAAPAVAVSVAAFVTVGVAAEPAVVLDVAFVVHQQQIVVCGVGAGYSRWRLQSANL